MFFPPYPWQQQKWNYLLGYKEREQLPHAILMHGSRGLGKREFAQAFAHLLLCSHATTKPCGKCAACLLLRAANHPDLTLIQLEQQSKFIKIEQIRELIDKLAKSSTRGGYQVAIINSAELLHPAAANALLKTLEEPPANVVLILVTDHLAQLPATIISRSQLWSFVSPPSHAANQWLNQQGTFSNIELALALAGGAPLQALQLLQEEGLAKWHHLLADLTLLKEERTNVVVVAERYASWEMKLLLLIFMYIVEDLIKLKTGAETTIVNRGEEKNLTLWAAATKLPLLFKFYTELVTWHKYLLHNINFNHQLTRENIFLSFTKLFI